MARCSKGVSSKQWCEIQLRRRVWGMLTENWKVRWVRQKSWVLWWRERGWERDKGKLTLCDNSYTIRLLLTQKSYDPLRFGWRVIFSPVFNGNILLFINNNSYHVVGTYKVWPDGLHRVPSTTGRHLHSCYSHLIEEPAVEWLSEVSGVVKVRARGQAHFCSLVKPLFIPTALCILRLLRAGEV